MARRFTGRSPNNPARTNDEDGNQQRETCHALRRRRDVESGERLGDTDEHAAEQSAPGMEPRPPTMTMINASSV